MVGRMKWQVLSIVLLLGVGILVAACGGSGNAASSTQASAAVTQNLMISADTVQGSKNIPADQKANRSCVLSSRFPRNSEMVWRARIVDPATGDVMDNTVLDKVQVQLANGQTVDMKYGAHPKTPPNEYYWTGSWEVPKDAPTGTLNYTIVATAKDGRTGEFKPITSVAASLPAITDEVYADVPVTTPVATPKP